MELISYTFDTKNKFPNKLFATAYRRDLTSDHDSFDPIGSEYRAMLGQVFLGRSTFCFHHQSLNSSQSHFAVIKHLLCILDV
jgi:hypothetical protein